MYLTKQEQQAVNDVFDIVKNSIPIKRGWNEQLPTFIREAVNRHVTYNKNEGVKKLTSLLIYPYGSYKVKAQ